MNDRIVRWISETFAHAKGDSFDLQAESSSVTAFLYGFATEERIHDELSYIDVDCQLMNGYALSSRCNQMNIFKGKEARL